MKGVESIGLIKFDFLGLKNLTLIQHCVEMIKQNRGVEIDMARLDLEDPEAYKLLCASDTLGVFQLESSGMRQLISRLKPSCFEDVIALVALYRPGPLQSGMANSFILRKHGEEEIDYMFDELEPVMRGTYGVCIYQEQVMQIANILASYSLGEADLLRRAMGKKIAEEMAKQRVRFVEGAKQNGHDPQKVSELFDKVEKFAAYGFNKSHSAAYGLVAYQTAWLKAHYRHEYMAALLTADAGNSDKVLLYLNDCRKSGLEVLPPDVNLSQKGFSVNGEQIRFALSGIKGLGDAAIDSILEARKEGGAFRDLFDFCERVDAKRVNKKVLESLIKCGAFDSSGHTRSGMLLTMEEAIQYGQSLQKDKNSNQISMFDLMAPPDQDVNRPVIQERKEWSEKERLQFEKETLGFYISGHPLHRYERDIRKFTSAEIVELSELPSKAVATFAGIITSKREMTTKKGDRMAFVVLEDMTGSVEVTVFPKTYAQSMAYLESEQPLVIRGEIENEENQVRVKAQDIRSLVEARASKVTEIHLHLSAERLSEMAAQHLY
ncbi:MAG: DNA polymerase III subunit alpha, partial [Myxococcota bacterium]